MQKTTPVFGNFLRKERNRLKLTQQGLATELKIGMNNYAHYEGGQRYPHDAEMWDKLAGLFKWSPTKTMELRKQVVKEYEEAVNVE